MSGICKPLDAASLADVAKAAQWIKLPARSTLFREGDRAGRVYTIMATIMAGFVKLTLLLPDGKQQVVGFCFAGHVAGFTDRAAYPFGAELLTDAKLCRLELSQLADLRKCYPALEHRLLDPCIQEPTATQEQLVTVDELSAEARDALLLRSLATATKRRAGDLRMLEMSMRRSDTTHFLGLTLETISRCLIAFRKRGWIGEPVHQRVDLVDAEALAALADGALYA